MEGAHVWVAESIEGAHVLGRGINRGCARFGSRNQEKVRTFWVAGSIEGAHVLGRGLNGATFWVMESIEGAHVLGRGIH